ncbi:MAG: ATP-dependent Clp protease ATP-binding subunit [Myxococcales bacterium]|nr:ATP-dependent Clp protease ATP-binding subunit [Myxococcales bacterium]
MTLHASTELRQVLAEAEDIARQTSQRFTTAHLLLALFTVPNRAEILLKEKKIDEDAILALVHTVEDEPASLVRLVQHKARQLASGCGAEAVDCLHLLIAMCGARDSLAYDLLRRTGLVIPAFRNTALSYVTGRLPRRLAFKPRDGKQARAGERAPAAAIASAGPAPAGRLQTEAPSLPGREAVEVEDPADEAAQEEIDQASLPPPDSPAAAWELAPEEFPMLSRLGRNLTAQAAQGRIDPLIGREREIEEVIDTLLKRRANNPLLVGEPGVGKTAIVEGLACGIVQDAPGARALGRPRIIELDVSALLAGTQLRGAFSEKLGKIREEVGRARGKVIVFFDELHTLIGAGSTGDGPQDAANELKSALARGEFPCIGATTHDEYRRHVQNDPAFARRFHVIQVPEPSAAQTLQILEGLAEEYARHHGVSYDREALQAAVRLASRYLPERCLPDKAIALIDRAGSRARRSEKSRVDVEAVARVVSASAGIPVERLLMTDAERLLNMERILSMQLIGHTPVVRAIARVIRRNYAGFSNRRPIGSFLFLGPTGVGKTECARVLAQFLFGSRESFVSIDMSEYGEPHSLSRLVGSPPGYVGHDEGGQLTEAVRRRPYTLILFDEVEKAHPEVQLLLLQLLDEGRLTDGKGRTVDFTNTVIVLTSNLGCEALGRPPEGRIGFGAKGDAGRAPEFDPAPAALETARRAFPPELWGRLDEHLFFRPLVAEDLAAIATLLLRESSTRLQEDRAIRLEAGPEVAAFLAREGCPDLTLGARPLRAALRRLVEEPVAEAILAGRFVSGDVVRIATGPQGLRFDKGETRSRAS